MSTKPIFLAVFLVGAVPATAFAEGLRLFPPDVRLSGPGAAQRLLVVREDDGRVVGDVTARVTWASSAPGVALVDPSGVVKAVGDGGATLTARLEGQQVAVPVRVTGAGAPAAWSFRNDVTPVMTRAGCNSGACHGALAGKGGLKLSLRGYDPEADAFVLTRQAGGRRVDRVQPSQSLLLLKPTRVLPHGGGTKLEAGTPDYDILAQWVAQGAPGPRADDAVIQRLEVYPPAAVLKPEDTLQVVVRAWYSDGRCRDVTHWAKYSSTEDLVATVDAEGRVKVAGHGEAAVTVWFSNLVASIRVTSPYPNRLPPATFPGAERRGLIDELVLRKLEALRLPPSPPCTDAEFIRRAYLDAAGILPTPDEVTRFVGDRSPQKRAQLIDGLLERPEFIDYWAYKWSDLLLVSTRKLSAQGTWSFYQYIRQGVADNKPWDRFAREILTASGSTLQNGAANYYVLHKDVTDLSEATAVTFLGMSVTCCRCHNHPLEKWTQDQYWGMANLFSRVALKNGDRAGEVSVQGQPFGDVPHPRRGVAMPPTPLDGRPLPPDSARDRRAYFADWLTAPDNPYFARAAVNRVWRNFLGRGLVEAEDDLRATNPPTNEELLAALEKDFIAHKYDVKYLIRQIMNSAAYQRSAVPLPGNAADDRFYSRYLIRRLPAEVVLDAYSQVTGVPTAFTQVNLGSSGGQSAYGGAPPGTRALQLPDSLVVSGFLDTFGRAERSQTCSCERQQDSSVGQALHLNNGQTLNDKLRNKSARLEQWAQEKVGDEEAIRRVFLLALSRPPTAGEVKKFTGLLAEAARTPETTRREVLEDLFWAVLSSKEFLFNR